MELVLRFWENDFTLFYYHFLYYVYVYFSITYVFAISQFLSHLIFFCRYFGGVFGTIQTSGI